MFEKGTFFDCHIHTSHDKLNEPQCEDCTKVIKLNG